MLQQVEVIGTQQKLRRVTEADSLKKLLDINNLL